MACFYYINDKYVHIKAQKKHTDLKKYVGWTLLLNPHSTIISPDKKTWKLNDQKWQIRSF